ncbi:MAG TPA: hypothetical protein VGN14_00315, partial [Candidatus Elarobacter sp.]
MGREARCAAQWGDRHGEVTVHLDAVELRARGAFRAVAALATLHDVRVVGDTLHLRTGEGEDVALMLGGAAGRWAAALTTPPPSLAAKLGIAAATQVAVDGAIDDDALAEALAAGTPASDATADLIVARVDDAAALDAVVQRHAALLARGVPLWVVYTKGKSAPL